MARMLRVPVFALTFLACAAPAGASTLERPSPDAKGYIWTGTAADDTLTITAAEGGGLTFTANDEIVVTASGCSASPATTVTCEAGTLVTARGGDGDDTWSSDVEDVRTGCEMSASERASEEWRLVNQAKRENMDGDSDSAPDVRREAPGFVVHRFAVLPRGTVVRKLRVGGLARRSTVTFRCRGESCPFAKKTLRPKRRRVALETVLGGRALRRGVVLTIEIDARGRDTKLFGYGVRDGRQPIRFS